MNFARLSLAALIGLSSMPLNAQVTNPISETIKTAKGAKTLSAPVRAPAAALEAPAEAPLVAANAPEPASPAATPDASPTLVSVNNGGGSGSILPAIPGAPTEERIQLDKITTLNTIKQQEFLQRVHLLTEERDEQLLKNTIMAEKLRSELAPIEHEQKKLQLKGQMEDERTVQATAALRYQRDKSRLDNDVAREKLNADQVKADADKLRRDIIVQELDFQSRKLHQESEVADNKTVAIKADLDLREKKEIWNCVRKVSYNVYVHSMYVYVYVYS